MFLAYHKCNHKCNLVVASGKNYINTVCFLTQTARFVSDRQERFDLKISKLKLLWKQRHLHLGCP